MSQCNANKYGTLKNTQHLEPGICLDMAFGSPKDHVCVFWGVPMTDCNVWDHPTPSRIAPPKLSLGLLWITSVSRNLASIHAAKGLALEMKDRSKLKLLL